MMILNSKFAASGSVNVWYQKPQLSRSIQDQNGVIGRVRLDLGKILLVVVLLCIFVALGFWQLERAREKQNISDRFISRSGLAVVELHGAAQLSDEMRFRTASARGRFESEFELLLDNKIEGGRAGYHVLTPLRIENSDTLLLVNRGWAPWTGDRRTSHQVEPPDSTVTVRGRLSLPAVAPLSFEQDSDLSNFSRVWQNFDLTRFRNLVEVPVVNFVLEQEPDDSSPLIRNWPVYEDSWIQRHRGYAFQWFSLAAVLLVATIVFALRRR